MQRFLSLIMALEYIEANLTNPFTLEDVASSAWISLSHLHRMFTRVFGCSLKEYITKRRLCSAAHDLIHSQASITELAFTYQYSSVESFSRAFRKHFRTSPSGFRQQNRISELYPKMVLVPDTKNGGEPMVPVPKYDLSELSKRILNAKGTYILDVDIDYLMRINDELGWGAGDVAIAETAARIRKSIPPETAFFRIAADEFIVITGLDELQAAKDIAQKIVSYADDQVNWNDTTFAFSVSVGIARVPEDINELKPALDLAREAMFQAKEDSRNSYRAL
ncbi:MAG: helix-turn-helix domain-containing protein [Firmicutes bacterium]|nr:helix-turn-helix domain-containing protein [Bacillota bacterium]